VDQRFEKAGLVSGATFSDLDGDGTPELLLACEWGPLRIFRRRDGRYAEWDPEIRPAGSLLSVNRLPSPQPSPVGRERVPPQLRGRVRGSGGSWLASAAAGPKELSRLSQLTGWWTGVATGDLDGDGRPDVVLGNRGLNGRDRPSPERPLRLRYGDLAEDGVVDVIESMINPATGVEVPRRGLRPVREAIPFVRGRILSFEAYGQASLADVYGEALQEMASVEIVEWASVVLLNRGDHFAVVPLPAEAQLAPAFGIAIADFNGDGFEDVLLSQNFFAVHPDDWRQDAGRGLLLLGAGDGRLRAVPGQESGVRVYGEQRGCAAADYDGDGRADVVIAQNANRTVLLQNRGARPGLRVRLAGGEGNPEGIGASIRLRTAGELGPAREVQAGSGYWSRHSSVQVLAGRLGTARVWVRWPGGRVTESEVPEGAAEVHIRTDGTLRRGR